MLLKRLIKTVDAQKRDCIRVLKKYPVRKPIWYPTPPSKIFNIREKPPFDACKEFLQQEYELHSRSLCAYLEKYTKENVNLEDINELERKEQATLLAENDKENEKQKTIREARIAEFNRREEEDMLELMAKETIELEAKNKQLNNMVLEEIERSKSYITKDKLEKAIEEALDNPVSYEFAIDLKGGLHYDQTLHPYALKPTALP